MLFLKAVVKSVGLAVLCLVPALSASTVMADIPSPAMPVYTDYYVPKQMSICGEVVPLNYNRVYEMLDRELTISAWDRAQTFMWIKRAGRFFPYMESQMRKEGVPVDLKYLAVAESALLPEIRSPAGAIGVWQFMPATGRKHGLRKDRWVDERRSFELATGAAIQYLKELKEKFGSWILAMAAYNCGENRLDRLIKEQKQGSYFHLDLPKETERYIFRILAIKLIMESPGTYGYKIDPERVYRPDHIDRVVVSVKYPVEIQDMADRMQMTYKEFKEMNRHFTQSLIPEGTFLFCVPSGKGNRVRTVIEQLASEQKPTDYVVRKGDTLNLISKKTGVSVTQIRQLNRIKGSLIVPGQRLRLE